MTIHTLLALVAIPLLAWLNRVRGGGLGGQYLRSSPDIWVAPFFALAAVLLGMHVAAGVAGIPALSWPAWLTFAAGWPSWATEAVTGLLFALCWLSWSTPAWGHLYRLGFLPPPTDRPPSWYEALFIAVSGGNLFIAFGLRMTVFLIPMALFFGWPWILLGPLMVGAYTVGWRIAPAGGIPYAELLTGALWGLGMVALIP